MNSKIFPFEIQSKSTTFDEFVKIPHSKSNDDLSLRFKNINTNPSLLENQKQPIFKSNNIIPEPPNKKLLFPEPSNTKFIGFTDIKTSSINLALMVLNLNLSDYENMSINELMKLSTDLDNMKLEALNILLYYKQTIPNIPKPISLSSVVENKSNSIITPDGYYYLSDPYTTADFYRPIDDFKSKDILNKPSNPNNPFTSFTSFTSFNSLNKDLNTNFI